MNNTQDQTQQIAQLQSQLNDLQSAYYKNNFSSHQDFNKASTFNTSLKVPVFTSLPTCEVGQICVYQHDYGTGVRNNLMVAIGTNSWVTVGLQNEV